MKWLSYGSFQEHDANVKLYFDENHQFCDFERSRDFNGLGTFSYALSIQGEEVDELRTVPLRNHPLRQVMCRGLYNALSYQSKLRDRFLYKSRLELQSTVNNSSYDGFFTRELNAIDQDTMRLIQEKIPIRVLWLSFTPLLAPISVDELVLRGFTHIFVVDPQGADYLRDKGYKAFYLPFAMSDFNPEIQADHTHCAGFVGTIYAGRLPLIRRLAKENLDFQFWSSSYDQSMQMMAPELRGCHRGRAFGKGMLQAIASCKLIVNPVHRAYMGNLADNVINFRLFESLSVGTFPISEFKPCIKELFDPDQIETYQNPEELIEKIQYYCSHPQKLSEMISKARKRCQEEHLYSHRMKALLEIVSS